jgi:NADH-quinone oxidoreductase subunit C
MTAQELFISLEKSLGEKLQRKAEFRGETAYTISAVDLRDIAKFCRDELSFDYLLDITSIDNFGEEPRFEIVYHLYSMRHAAYLRLKLKLSEELGAIETVSDIWPTANWHEREIYDMMGIKFNGHPDLRRILMWDGYPYFPLRKDFPLAGLPSEMPEVAFTKITPLEGGPFVTIAVVSIMPRRPGVQFQACAWRPSRLDANVRRLALRASVPASDRRSECAALITR